MGRVVFGLQCQQCGEEHRIGLRHAEIQLIDSNSDDPKAEGVRWDRDIACEKCGATGQIRFANDSESLDWVDSDAAWLAAQQGDDAPD